MQVDFLIVGQGLAGSVLARTLLRAGKSVHLVDTHRVNSASRVAAGMFNPIVFKRLNKSWMADEALPFAADFYQAWEQELGLNVWHPTPIIRIFPGQEAANDFAARSASDGFAHILHTETRPDGEAQTAPFGYGVVEGSGYLELGLLLDTQRQAWMDAGLHSEADWREEDTEVTPDGVTWNGITADHIILCQGHALLDGSWFGDLPLRRTKGEVVDVHQPGLALSHIVNNGRWAIPLGEGRFRLGATYEWHTGDPSITPEACALLLDKLAPVVGEHPEVQAQRGGIRPAVKDRRPLLGTHPQLARVHVFNGMGTRGVMIAPTVAEWMRDHMLGVSSLPPVADIQRFSE
ncbi:MAG: NAD(P)/FAD-dependent oxidoreductase [Flavobacteriales bacterium]